MDSQSVFPLFVNTSAAQLGTIPALPATTAGTNNSTFTGGAPLSAASPAPSSTSTSPGGGGYADTGLVEACGMAQHDPALPGSSPDVSTPSESGKDLAGPSSAAPVAAIGDGALRLSHSASHLPLPGKKEARMARRREQNRNAQRALRQRKESRINELETLVSSLQLKERNMMERSQQLSELIGHLQYENSMLRDMATASVSRSNAPMKSEPRPYGHTPSPSQQLVHQSRLTSPMMGASTGTAYGFAPSVVASTSKADGHAHAEHLPVSADGTAGTSIGLPQGTSTSSQGQVPVLGWATGAGTGPTCRNCGVRAVPDGTSSERPALVGPSGLTPAQRRNVRAFSFTEGTQGRQMSPATTVFAGPRVPSHPQAPLYEHQQGQHQVQLQHQHLYQHQQKQEPLHPSPTAGSYRQHDMGSPTTMDGNTKPLHRTGFAGCYPSYTDTLSSALVAPPSDLNGSLLPPDSNRVWPGAGHASAADTDLLLRPQGSSAEPLLGAALAGTVEKNGADVQPDGLFNMTRVPSQPTSGHLL